MNATQLASSPYCADYAGRLQHVLRNAAWTDVTNLIDDLFDCWRHKRQVFLCGNGGSAANALHLVNDFVYGIAKGTRPGLRATALPANTSLLTCLANDEGYETIYSGQLAVLASPGDILIALSGSGNSPNILEALKTAKAVGMKSYGILGFSGGKAKGLADVAIHFPVDDMQICEDLQLIVGHMVMQQLYRRRMEIE